MRLTRPASTLPAPSSTKRVTPSARHIGDALAPAHRRPSPARRGSARIAAGSVTALAADIGDQRRLGRDESSTSFSASAIASAAGCISAQWKGADTGSSSARLAPFELGELHRPLDRRLGAGDRRPGRRRCRWRPGRSRRSDRGRSPPRVAIADDGAEIEAEDRRHRAFADRNRLLHRLAAQAQAAAPHPRG